MTYDLTTKFTGEDAAAQRRRLDASTAAVDANAAEQWWYDRVASNLLLQATYGPTPSELRNLSATLQASAAAHGLRFASSPPALEEWVVAQLGMAVTSQRKYMRERANEPEKLASSLGQIRGACEPGSRWRRQALTRDDATSTLVLRNVSASDGTFVFGLYVDGRLRTEVDPRSFFASVRRGCPGSRGCRPEHQPLRLDFPYILCDSFGYTYLDAVINLGVNCTGSNNLQPIGRIDVHNPPLTFSKLQPPTTGEDGLPVGVLELNADDATFADLDPPLLYPYREPTADGGFALQAPSPYNSGFKVLRELRVRCSLSQVDRTKHGTYLLLGGAYYMHDRRLVTLENTLKRPAVNITTTFHPDWCPNAPKTFVNRDACTFSRSCSPLRFSDRPVHLNESTLRTFYTAGGSHVYYLDGLRLEGTYRKSPCATKTSRWRSLPSSQCSGSTPLHARSLAILRDALLTTDDQMNPLVRDVTIVQSTIRRECISTSGDAAIGATVEVNGTCWQHTHPSSLNVYDFSKWVQDHPGNRPNFNPIKDVAVKGNARIVFPASHSASRMSLLLTFRLKRLIVGRLDDKLPFKELIAQVQTLGFAEAMGEAVEVDDGNPVEVCGSPYEVANVPELGWRTRMRYEPFDMLPPHYHYPNADFIQAHAMAALYAPDQLRQRVAFALWQFWVVGKPPSTNRNNFEPDAYYYDIMVRHAFGNLRQLMREVAFSSKMARFLTFYQSYSQAYSGAKPDENFAREIMQLFTIGLWEISEDGTKLRDEHGEPIQTYDNGDIVAFARAWTGFDSQIARGNYIRGSDVDPMRIHPYRRDLFPKMDLYDGHLGDGYPLCDALPPKAFLRRGARYSYLGHSPEPKLTLVTDWSIRSTPHDVKYLELNGASSALHAALCDADGSQGASSGCSFKSEVVLDANLPCDGRECAVDTALVVGVRAPGSDGPYTYFEYVRVPCVGLPFFGGGRVVELSAGRRITRQCSAPGSIAASPACCTAGQFDGYPLQHVKCDYVGENVNFHMAMDRCNTSAPAGQRLCPTRMYSDGYATALIQRGDLPTGCPVLTNAGELQFRWSQDACEVQAQVGLDGMVSVVHAGALNNLVAYNKLPNLQVGSGNVFRVRWQDGLYPLASSNCTRGCTVFDDTCVCDATVTRAAVFTDAAAIPSASEVDAQLRIGSSPPDHFDAGEYTQCTTSACAAVANVALYTKGTAGAPLLDMSAIFRIVVNGSRVVHLANLRSTVSFGVGEGATSDGTASDGVFSFRNPPQFMSLQQPSARDAQYETEALLDHLFHHRNTAPFTATRIIQNLVTSNPSPRYMRAVVSAFKTGSYNGRDFSGAYGDLGATVAAILLDPEARSLVLQNDPSFGMVRDPMQKLYHLMRAMQYVPANGADVRFDIDLEKAIGMAPYGASSVFSFYLPEYTPTGAAQTAQLYAPAAQLGTMPFVVRLLSGLTSLIRYGLVGERPYDGFAYGGENLAGTLMFQPRNASSGAATVAELDLLLAGGRLSEQVRTVVADTYDTALAQSGPVEALKVAQQLVVASPEFGTNTDAGTTSNVAPSTPPRPSLDRPYKAIVVLFLVGGLDSFNMLVPHSGCNASVTSYEQYLATRTGAAIVPKSTLLQLATPTGTQPCSTFGLHRELPLIRQLYNDGDALFTANMGPLVEPIESASVLRQRRKPRGLYSHSNQQTATRTLLGSGSAFGVLGRLVDTLAAQGTTHDPPYATGSYSISDVLEMVNSKGQPPMSVSSLKGVVRFQGVRRESLGRGSIEAMVNVTSLEAASPFAETANRHVRDALLNSESLGAALEEVTASLHMDWSRYANKPGNSYSYIGQELYQVARLISARQHLRAERDVFYVDLAGWDSHSCVIKCVEDGFKLINPALSLFVSELKGQGLWDNVVIQLASDFARTLKFNGKGTDHAWGGHYWTIGGNVSGGKIHGTYPSLDLVNSPLIADQRRGTVIPTTPWEAIWKPLAQWFGVEDERLSDVLPNLPNFGAEHLLTVQDVFGTSASV